jgi:carbamoyltransferase
MNILGISAFYHDSAAALVIDGEIAAAAQEERFTRRKHEAGFPGRAIAYCLEHAGLRPDQLDFVAFYDKPLLKFERLLETQVAFAPNGFRSFATATPVWLHEKLRMRRAIRGGLAGESRAPLLFLDHHESHAASAFFPSPFDEAAILTIDGVGEWTTAAWGAGRGNRLELRQHVEFPHSLGLLYSAFTYYCGFKVNSGEHKVMGLAPYGKPIYRDTILRRLIDLKPDGSFRLNMDYFNYCQGLTMTNRRFAGLFGGPPRAPESEIEQRHKDLAASIQSVAEEIVLRMGCDIHRKTGMKRLVLAGGVALNCVANGRLLREGPYEDIWIQPAAGDAGGALGAALFTWHQLLDKPRFRSGRDSQKGSFLGPSFSQEEIERYLDEAGADYTRMDGDDALTDCVAALLAQQKVVGWFHGRMEFGPRALGARSILADPRPPGMQATINLKIKFRESFRPFAPAVLKEHAHRWFAVREGQESPYMLLVAPVREEHRAPHSSIPAITHVDHSARLQTVDPGRHPRFYQLIERFYAKTGCPMLVNTSFNVRGEPIVCTPHDAYRCFLATGMDALALENFVILKNGQAGLQNRPTRSGVRRQPMGPSERTLRQFSALWILFFAIVSIRLMARENSVAAAVFAALAFAAGTAGFKWPRVMRPIFVGWMRVAHPIGRAVSRVALGIAFFGLFTPIGLFFRAIGRDALALRLDERAATYWRDKPAPSGSAQYLRQF